ncbi:MAG: ATP-binding protein [Chloroflexi bacterium]|nr:ATP-binding protein [Chloroflexota bacterium]
MSARSSHVGPLVVLLGGPAGAGKSTLSRAWCGNRPRAAHIDLDEVRQMIIGGFADPQQSSSEQTEQFELAARQCVSLARNFLRDGFDVIVESTFLPDEYRVTWEPLLMGLNPILVVLVPDLSAVLGRSSERKKNVLETYTRTQREACLDWPGQNRLDTTGQSVEESRQALDSRISDLHQCQPVSGE